MNKYEYRVVRSYTDGCFAEGFEFVRASEVVTNYSGKSDYIVRKEVNNE